MTRHQKGTTMHITRRRNRPDRRRPGILHAVPRAAAALVTSLLLVVGVLVPTAAQAAGSGVLNVTITPVSDTGGPLTEAKRGTNGNHVSYRVDYSCAVANCDNAIVKISAPQANPWGIAVTGAMAPSLLRYQNWTPPTAGFAAPPSGDDVSGKTFSLGTLPAGSSGSFTAVYGFGDATRSPAAGSMYPDGFQIVHSATISSTTATADAAATAAAVRWFSAGAPAPAISLSNPGVVRPDTDVAYKIYMTDGSVFWSNGNFVGNAALAAAGNSTVTLQLPAEAVLVNAGGGVYDAASRTVTWSTGTLAAPVQCAAGGWGLNSEPQNSWNTAAPCQVPRSFVVRYPASGFPAADANGCNFEAPVSPKATVDVNYLDTARTLKSATAGTTQTVSCYDPFGRTSMVKDVTNSGTTAQGRSVPVPPDTTGLVCPTSGRDDWGRTCTPGQPLAPFAAASNYWAVTAYNAGNVPGRMKIVDNDLDQPGLAVTRISATLTSTIAYTYRCGSAAPVSGTATSSNLQLSSITPGADCRFTAATVTSLSDTGPGNIRPSDGNVGTPFQVLFSFLVAPGTALGQRTNTATSSIDYTAYPQIGSLAAPQRSITANLVEWPKALVKVGITAAFPAAPVVSGGGQPVPGKDVTFTTGGSTSAFAGDSTFEPQYVFFPPVGWTIKPGSAAFGPDAPAGVRFDYRTVTVGGQPREAVVASWPAGTTVPVNREVPRMTVVASPTYQVAPGTSSVAAAWLGDSRNTVWTSATANFAAAALDAPDVDADGLTSEVFSTAQNSGAGQVGAASASSVTKQICQPDATAADGCRWIGDPANPVQVSTVANAIKYRVIVRNTGNTNLTGVVAYDVLPYVGDTGTSTGTSGTPRGSTFNETLVSASSSAPGAALSYSSSTNPPRPEVYSGATTGAWSAPMVGARALRMQYGSTLTPGQSVTFEYTAGVGSGSGADARACNSVALASAQTLPSEPPAVCAVTSEADLAVTAPAAVQAQIGRPTVLPFTVTNHGGSATAVGVVTIDVPAGVTVTGLAPAGWTCTAASAAPVTGPATLSCVPDAALAKGVATRLDLPVIVTRDDVVVTGTASGPAYDPDHANDTDSIRIAAAPAPAGGGLTVSKSDGAASAVAGAQLTYTVTVRNELVAESVSGATVVDTLPAGTEFDSASGGGTLTAGKVTWTVPSIGAGASITRTVTVRVTEGAPTTIVNEATATAVDPAFPTRTVEGRGVDTDTVERLGLTKTGALANPTAPKPGDIVTYTFVLTNRGGGALSGVTISDPMPGLSAIAISSWPSLPNRLGAGQSVTGTATYTLTQADIDSGAVVNTASGAGTTADAAAVPATATATIPLASRPALSLDKTATVASAGAPRPGDVVTYAFVLRNTGNVTVSGATISDPLPGLGPVTVDAWPGAVGVLAAGQSVRATAVYVLTAADVDRGRLDNTATATGTAAGGAPVRADDTVRTDLPETAALTLTKSGVQDDPLSVAAGDTIRYSFTVVNSGNVTLTGVALADALPGLSAISFGAWPGATGVLAAGQSVTATATYTTTQADVDAGHVDNVATATATAPSGAAASATDATTVSIPADPALALEKTASLAGAARAGSVVTYSFVVRNAGSLTVSGVTVTDPLAGLSSISFGAWPGATGVLAPGAEVTATATYTLTQQDVDRGRIDNIATASGTAPGDHAVTATDGNTLSLDAAPAVTLSKVATGPGGRADAGDEVSYAFTIENTGTVTLTSVSLTDALPGLSAISFGAWPGTEGRLAPGQKVTASAVYALTQGDVDAGSVRNTATVDAVGVRGGAVAATDEAVVDLAAAPGIRLTKTATPRQPATAQAGDEVAYTFVVENTGNVTVGSVGVTDALPGLSAIAFGPWPGADGTLSPGEKVTATAVYTLTQDDLDAGSVFNEAVASATAVRGGTVDGADDVTVVLPADPALSFEKTGSLEDDERPLAGQNATFTFTVRNTGNVTVSGVGIDDPLDGLGAIEYSGWPGDAGILAPGQSVTAAAVYKLTQADVDAGRLDNAATVSGQPARGDEVVEEASTTVPIAAVPGLSLVKSAQLDDADRDGRANPGERVAYRFEVVNTGNVTLTQVLVDDPKVRGLSPIAELAPGEKVTVSADPYTVTEADARAGAVRNTATVTGAAPGGAPVTSDPSSTTTAAALPPAGGGLATTGGPDVRPLVPLAGVMLILGIALLLRRRRKALSRA
ncbi:MAG: DUF11 domain-containing protein [Microbacterium sp.]|nr:DUF11 domain-containing protein [Microbacterium sp.]